MADFIGSTSQMEKYVMSSDKQEFIVGTEIGLIHKLEQQIEGKTLYQAHKDPTCYNMKKNTLETIKHTIENQPSDFLVRVSEDIAERNRKLLNEMLKNSR